ncbi:MAG TPA: DUF4245 family protein [Nocardioidaceae bacterium]|nr:DUF4245 family protein [Nocardioidaceae bacterium]
MGSPGRAAARTPATFVAALVVVVAVVAGLWGLGWWQRRTPTNPVPTVRYGATLAQARLVAPFAVLAPAPAPAGWRATSVDWTTHAGKVSWHLGFLTPDDEYVGLEQSNRTPRTFVAVSTTARRAGGSRVIDGQSWRVLLSPSQRALVHDGPGVTTVVTGTGTLAQLAAFVRTLR